MEVGKGRLVYNFHVDNSILKKIPGTILYLASQIGNDPIKYIGIFLYRWIYQIGKNLIIETSEGSQTETLISSDLDQARFMSDEWQETIYLSNGTDFKFYDGTNFGDIGLLPPGLGITPRRTYNTLTDIGGGSLPAGTYSYTFTYFDPRTQTESLPMGALVAQKGLFVSTQFDATDNVCGWSSFPVSVGASGKVKLSFSVETIAYLFGDAPSRAGEVNLYRQDPGQTTFRLVTTFTSISGANKFSFDIVGGYIDNTTLANLGPLLIADQLTPPPTVTGVINAGAVGAVAPRYIRFWRDTLWIFGGSFPRYTVSDATTGITNINYPAESILYGSDTSLPDYYPFDYNLGRNDGQKATGLAVSYDTLAAYKQRSIYAMIGSDITNFIPKIIDSVRGCIAPGSLQETPLGAVFLAEDGVCVCTGMSPAVLISEEVDDEIKTINFAAIDAIVSSYDRFRSKYRMYFPTGTGTDNTRYIEFDLKKKTWAVGQAYSPTSVKYGINSTLQTKIMVGKRGGRIIEVSNPANPIDDGQAIYSVWQSDEFDFGVRGRQKRLLWLDISAACSENFIISIKVFSDYGQGPILEIDDFDSEDYWAKYASSASDPTGAVYDTDRYSAAQTFQRVRIPIQGMGKTFFIQIIEKESDKTLFEIHSIEIHGEVFGK